SIFSFGFSIFTPSASRRSELPHFELAARLPCLATRTPQEATTIAATVEMLNVPSPSPPVPHVSRTTPGPASTRTARWRIARAQPAISSTVSPFILRAVRKAAIWAGVAAPSMISPVAAAASSAERDVPAASRAKLSLSTRRFYYFLLVSEKAARYLLAPMPSEPVGPLDEYEAEKFLNSPKTRRML